MVKTVKVIIGNGDFSLKLTPQLPTIMDKHHQMAGRLQLGVAVLYILGAMAAIAIFVAIGSINWSGTSHFNGGGFMDFLGSFIGLLLVAVVIAGAAQLQIARSWLKGNQRAKYPLACFSILQIVSLYLAPIACYTLWALFRTLPDKSV